MERYEYIRLPINIIQYEIIAQYNLRTMSNNVYVYAETRKVIYGLPQVGRIENQFLTKILAPTGYYQCCHTPGL